MSNPTYLVDNDWAILALKGKTDALDVVAALSSDGLAISLVSYGEIYQGVYYGRDPQRHEQDFLAFLRGIDVLPLNKSIMKLFARTRGDLRAKGAIIGDFDILIAATALHYDLTLLTKNVKHFERISGLRLYQDSQPGT